MIRADPSHPGSSVFDFALPEATDYKLNDSTDCRVSQTNLALPI